MAPSRSGGNPVIQKPGGFGGLSDFLQPNSMLTPGIAGMLTSGISLPLAINFHLSLKWTALVISFLLGLVIIQNIRDHLPVWQRGVSTWCSTRW